MRLKGKMDLIVDLNFRMDTSALYSDIILPAATWYEKADLNSTDMHSFIHPLSPAVPPCWESKSDWAIFKELAKKFSQLAERHFPDKVEDVVAAPLAHDSPAEIAQPDMKQWIRGECACDSRQDDACVQGGRSRLRQCLQPIHFLRSHGPAERSGSPRHAVRALPTNMTSTLGRIVPRRGAAAPIRLWIAMLTSVMSY